MCATADTSTAILLYTQQVISYTIHKNTESYKTKLRHSHQRQSETKSYAMPNFTVSTILMTEELDFQKSNSEQAQSTCIYLSVQEHNT